MFAFAKAALRPAMSIINEVREFGLKQSAYNIAMDMRDAFHRHFALQLGGREPGLFVRLPFTRLSFYVEWREVSVGLGIERRTGALEVFIGRVQGVASIEPLGA